LFEVVRHVLFGFEPTGVDVVGVEVGERIAAGCGELKPGFTESQGAALVWN